MLDTYFFVLGFRFHCEAAHVSVGNRELVLNLKFECLVQAKKKYRTGDIRNDAVT